MTNQQRGRAGRPQGIAPPPPIRMGDGRFPEGFAIIQEVGDDLAVFLWLTLRRLSAAVDQRLRRERAEYKTVLDEAYARRKRRTGDATPEAISPPSGESVDVEDESPAGRTRPVTCGDLEWVESTSAPNELRAALRTFVLTKTGSDPFGGPEVVAACELVQRWADRRGHLQTAAYFAEAAAYVDSEDAFRANEAGRVCRRANLDSRAHIWFFRAFGLAVRAKRHAEATQALLGQAALMYHLGEHKNMRRFLKKATRRAGRAGQRKQAAYAQHELVLEAAEARSYADGERHVLEALWLYPRSHQRFPAFVHDYGYLLAEQRIYSSALPLLKSALPLIRRPAEAAIVWANISRAAAGAGRVDLYLEAAAKVDQLTRDNNEHAAAATSIVAVAAWLAGDRERAQLLARRAHLIAADRRERYPAERAAMVLDGIKAERPPPIELAPPVENQIDSLTRQCLSRLRRWKPRPEAGFGPFYP